MWLSGKEEDGAVMQKKSQAAELPVAVIQGRGGEDSLPSQGESNP